MNFELTEDQLAVQEVARGFTEKKLIPEKADTQSGGV